MQVFSSIPKFLKSVFGVPSTSKLELPVTNYPPVIIHDKFVIDDFDKVPFVVTKNYKKHERDLNARLAQYESWFRGDASLGMLNRCKMCHSAGELFFEASIDYLEPTAWDVTRCEACLLDNGKKDPCGGQGPRSVRSALYYGNAPTREAFEWYEELICRYNSNRTAYKIESLIPEYESIFGGSLKEFNIMIASNWSDHGGC